MNEVTFTPEERAEYIAEAIESGKQEACRQRAQYAEHVREMAKYGGTQGYRDFLLYGEGPIPPEELKNRAIWASLTWPEKESIVEAGGQW